MTSHLRPISLLSSIEDCGVYCFGHGTYASLFSLPEPSSLISNAIKSFIPPILPRWSRSTMNPHAFQWMGRALNYFDTLSVVSFLRKGVDFGITGIPFGSRSSRRNGGSAEGLSYFKRVLIPDLIKNKKAVKVVNKKEKEKTVI